jgi:hypothetical protein
MFRLGRILRMRCSSLFKVSLYRSKVEAGNFTTLVYSVLLNVDKSVLKMTETLWENVLIIAKYVKMIHVNFTAI